MSCDRRPRPIASRPPIVTTGERRVYLLLDAGVPALRRCPHGRAQRAGYYTLSGHISGGWVRMAGSHVRGFEISCWSSDNMRLV